MSTDAELLHRYATGNDQRAFEELLGRYLRMVYSAALRRSGGRSDLAEDVAQRVFAQLALRASGLSGHPCLAGWLYRTTRNVALNALRTEIRRQQLVKSFHAMGEEPSTGECQADWERIRPVLDREMDRLKPADREIILLRFFNGRSFAEVGEDLGVTENAARMRTERALDRLRTRLARRGATSSGSALGLLLADHALAAMPAGLPEAIASSALPAAQAGAASVIASTLLMSKLYTPLLSAAVAALLATLIHVSVVEGVTADQIAAMRQENTRLTRQAALDDKGSPASVAMSRFAGRAASISAALEAKNARMAKALASGNRPREVGGVHYARHRNHGQATPHDAMLSFAWATDSGEVEALSHLIIFGGDGRQKALAVLASMPDSIQAEYRTPEQLYAYFLAADALVAPPPAEDVLNETKAVDMGPGRVALVPPGGTPATSNQFEQTRDGWKFVIPPQVVGIMPRILQNQTLAKLGNP